MTTDKRFVTSRWQGVHLPARSELVSTAVSFPPRLLDVPVLAPQGVVALQSFQKLDVQNEFALFISFCVLC